MRKKGYARIMQDEEGVYFRIEMVPRTQFSSVLDLFLARFPSRVWNDHRRAWQLPHHQHDALIKFAITTFGKERVVIDQIPSQRSFDDLN